MQKELEHSFKTSAELLLNFCENKELMSRLVKLSENLASTFENGHKILICGNGGSACDAMHFAEEFTGRYRGNRRALPVIHLGDPGHLTCVGNDFGFNEVFARGVEAFGKEGDWFIGLSTSGNSENVLSAVAKAQALGLNTCALLGKDGGKLKGKCDYEFIIPGQTADRIQEVHMTILHILIEGVERLLFPDHYIVTESKKLEKAPF